MNGLLRRFEKLTFPKCWFVVACIVFGGSLLGCGEQTPPTPPPPEKVEKTEPPAPADAANAEAAPEQTQEQQAEATPTPPVYEYDPTGRREPFKPLVEDNPVEPIDIIVPPDREKLLLPLQKFEVKQLKLTGIIMGSLGDFAKVSAPDGKSYTVNVGTPVGIYEGEIVSITDNSIVVREIIRHESGKVEEVETPLYLNPIKEEEK